LAIVCVLLGEFVIPVTEQRAEDRRAALVQYRANPLGAGGVWARDGGSYVNVRSLSAQNVIHGIYIYDVSPDHQVTQLTFAGTGKFDGDQSNLDDVHVTSLQPDLKGANTSNESQVEWKTLLSPELISLFKVDTDSLSARGLLHYIDYMRVNHLDDRR